MSDLPHTSITMAGRENPTKKPKKPGSIHQCHQVLPLILIILQASKLSPFKLMASIMTPKLKPASKAQLYHMITILCLILIMTCYWMKTMPTLFARNQTQWARSDLQRSLYIQQWQRGHYKVLENSRGSLQASVGYLRRDLSSTQLMKNQPSGSGGSHIPSTTGTSVRTIPTSITWKKRPKIVIPRLMTRSWKTSVSISCPRHKEFQGVGCLIISTKIGLGIISFQVQAINTSSFDSKSTQPIYWLLPIANWKHNW